MNPNYPMNGYQPNYNGQQILPCAQPKKRRTGLIIGLAVGTAVVVMGVAGILLSKSFMGGGAKQQFTKGMINFSNEMAAYSSGISQDIDIVALQKLSDEKPMHANIDLSFTDPEASGSFDNVSVEIDAVSDAKNKQEKFDVKVGTYGFDMDLGSVVADDNTLYFSSPLILQDDVYSLDLTNLGKDFNSSAWAELLETTIPEDGNYTLFDDDNDSAGIDAAMRLNLAKSLRSIVRASMMPAHIRSSKRKGSSHTAASWQRLAAYRLRRTRMRSMPLWKTSKMIFFPAIFTQTIWNNISRCMAVRLTTTRKNLTLPWK